MSKGTLLPLVNCNVMIRSERLMNGWWQCIGTLTLKGQSEGREGEKTVSESALSLWVADLGNWQDNLGDKFNNRGAGMATT